MLRDFKVAERRQVKACDAIQWEAMVLSDDVALEPESVAAQIAAGD